MGLHRQDKAHDHISTSFRVPLALSLTFAFGLVVCSEQDGTVRSFAFQPVHGPLVCAGHVGAVVMDERHG